jgi:nucleoid-associated protein YgaU
MDEVAPETMETVDVAPLPPEMEEMTPAPELSESAAAPASETRAAAEVAGNDAAAEEAANSEVELTTETKAQEPPAAISEPMAVQKIPTVHLESVAPSRDTAGSADVFSYVIKVGDTVSRVAKKIYGTEKQWQEIATASGLKNPNLIYPGNTLTVPVLNEKARNYRESHVDASTGSDGKIVFVVKPGDTLSSIAKEKLGHASLWNKIYDQNRDAIRNPDTLVVGQTLAISGNEAH